ncbi:RTA1-domain-containing protein [Xylariomycetidae sp. FL0641]|nr:RTA1-domain-containing protein [Xylariomycetidae sp. FL0641]
MSSLSYADVSKYKYDPSEAATIVATALFGVSFLYCTYLTIKSRAWVWTVMVVAVLLEVLGFGIRILSVNNVTSKPPYVVQFIFVVLAPVLMAGVIYVVFGRIVFHVVPVEDRSTRLLWVPPNWITPTFVTFDIIALVLQGAGAIIVSSTNPTEENSDQKIDRGRDIALGGLALQITAFTLFSVSAARFHFTSKRFIESMKMRFEKAEGDKTVYAEGKRLKSQWRTLLYVVNFACLLIMVRSVYRVVQFAEGPTGTVNEHEWYMYVFDALPMFAVTVIFNIVFPGDYLPYMGFWAPKRPASSRSLDSSDSREIPLRENMQQPEQAAA